MTIELGNEKVGTAARVADGFWILATKHRPSGSENFPEINNRCLVFRLVENGTPILLVINGVDPRKSSMPTSASMSSREDSAFPSGAKVIN